MIHVMTAHFRTGRWIEPQRRCLNAFVGRPYRVLCSVEDVSIEDGSSEGDERWTFIEQSGSHAAKLNALAHSVTAEADPSDVLMFLDGDALPVADLSALLSGCDWGVPVAIRRDENLNDPIPHPSFCAMTVRRWLEIEGNWEPGPTWVNSAGRAVSDVGARVWAGLRDREIPWTALLRTGAQPLHDVWFGVYGGAVYHHGAGFRFPICRVDEVKSQALSNDPEEQAQWCDRQGGGQQNLGHHVYNRIASDPVQTLFRYEDGTLFQGLGGSRT